MTAGIFLSIDPWNSLSKTLSGFSLSFSLAADTQTRKFQLSVYDGKKFKLT